MSWAGASIEPRYLETSRIGMKKPDVHKTISCDFLTKVPSSVFSVHRSLPVQDFRHLDCNARKGESVSLFSVQYKYH
jgi:hypothetical protein